jgi:hypothetical protein
MSGPDKCMCEADLLHVVSSYWATYNLMHETHLKLIQLRHSHLLLATWTSLQRNLFLAVLSTNFYGNRVLNCHSLLPALIIRIHSPCRKPTVRSIWTYLPPYACESEAFFRYSSKINSLCIDYVIRALHVTRLPHTSHECRKVPCNKITKCVSLSQDVDGSWIESRWGRDIPHLSRPVLRQTQTPIQRVLSGVKLPGCAVNHQPSSSAEVKERVELYLCYPFRSSWQIKEWTLINSKRCNIMQNVLSQ